MLTDDERKTIETAARALADEADSKRRTIHAAVFGHGRPDALDALAARLRAIAAPRVATVVRCSCTHEAGDSRCAAHPTCSACGEQTARNVDDCADHARGPIGEG